VKIREKLTQDHHEELIKAVQA